MPSASYSLATPTFPSINQLRCTRDMANNSSFEFICDPLNETKRSSMTPEQRQARVDRSRVRRQSMTIEQREAVNARRREVRRNKSTEERNDRQRVTRQKVPAAQRQENNDLRRARRQSIPVEEREEINARQRAQRKNVPEGERRALLARRNAQFAAKRDTPCAESIAMPCPDVRASTAANQPLGIPSVEVDSPPASPSMSTPEYTIGTDGNTTIFIPFIYFNSTLKNSHLPYQ